MITIQLQLPSAVESALYLLLSIRKLVGFRVGLRFHSDGVLDSQSKLYLDLFDL